MSMNNKQRWMGGVVLLGGGVLLAALLHKGSQELQEKNPTPTAITQSTAEKATVSEMQSLQPITVDVETEKRLLAEQRRSRERAVAEQEAKTQQYLAQQQQAEAAAAQKAAQEYAEINARRKRETESSDNIPPEVTKAAVVAGDVATPKSDIQAKKKASLEAEQQKQKDAEAKKKASLEAEQQKQKDADAKKQAEAKKKASLEAEQQKQKDADAKKQAEVKKKASLEAEHQKEVDAKKHVEVENKAKHDAIEAKKAREIMGTSSKIMVQVSLAANQANADNTVAKLRAKGYKVTTSPTSKGIRIMVGPLKDKDSATAIRKKIQSDESLGMKSAWVIDWVPLDQR